MNDINQNPVEKPFVSVIVPIYNVERYIKQCLDSIVRQTLKNIEIILVDDGSPDNCPAICDTYAEKDSRVKVIHQLNNGYGRACNAGFAAAAGEYIGIIESDDYAELDMFEKLYGLAKAYNLDVVRCYFYYFNSLANTHKRVDLPHIAPNTICSPCDVTAVFSQAPAIWSMIYRANFIRENNIRFLETPGAAFQDTSFVFKIFALADRFMLTGDTLIHYRIDNENSSSNSKNKMFCICDEFSEIERFINEKNLNEKLSFVIPKIKFPTYMWNYNRLGKNDRWVFLNVFAREMRSYIDQKIINKQHFSAREVFKFYVIAYFYPLFYLGRYNSTGGKK